MLEIAATEIEKFVSGREKLKTFAKDVGTKTTWKQMGNKKNLSVDPDPFLEKVYRKPVVLAKTFLTI